MRKSVIATLCAVALVAAPAAAGAQAGSLGSLTGGSSSSNPLVDARVAALKEAGVRYNESLGHRPNAEAERNAEAILGKAMRGEFIYVYIPIFDGTVGRSLVRNAQGAGYAYKLDESLVDRFLATMEDAEEEAGVSAPFGVAAGRDGVTFYIVEYFLGA